MSRFENSRTSRLAVLLALLGAIVLLQVVAGCGSDSRGAETAATKTGSTSASEADGGEKASEGLTKAELIRRGDSICRKADEKQTTGLRAFQNTNPKAESTASGRKEMVVGIGLPPIREEAEELSALNPPAGDEAEIDAIVKGIERALADAEEDPGSVLGPSRNPFSGVGELAGKYGFKDCSDAL